MGKFAPRQRKHKHRVYEEQKRQKAAANAGIAPASNANVAVILPPDRTEQEAKRKRMRDELRAQQPQSKINQKKQRRLDKYIDGKLKKEENWQLINKLAALKTDTSLLRSAKHLSHVSKSRREILSRALLECKAGIDVMKSQTIIEDASRPERRDAEFHTDSEEESDQEYGGNQEDRSRASHHAVPAVNVGGGLKRPLDLDDDGKPIIRKRKRTRPSPEALPEQCEWVSPGSEGETSDSEDGMSSATTSDQELNGNETSGEHDGDATTDAIQSDSNIQSGLDSIEMQERKARSSAFKAWATAERNRTVGYLPSTNMEALPQLPTKPVDFQPRVPDTDPLPPELDAKTTTETSRQAYSVIVQRPQDVQDSRLELPVVAEEQRIMEAIHNNDVVVIWGATGSGKTTQVPQFLFESGYGDPKGPSPGVIGVTQPRRVAAVSMASRVAMELGSCGKKVGYQIRFDASTGQDTAIKFMTDGILLREIAQDISLPQYSAIIIDEAHERSVNTDVLIGMMSRIVDLRRSLMKEDATVKPLKMIIMSATLRIADFTENERLFRSGPPPLLKAEGRQYPVTVHFARRTKADYVDEALQKIKRGHRKLPLGGMLVFLTGQNEIITLARRLRQAFPSTQGAEINQPQVRVSATDTPLEAEDLEIGDNDGQRPDDYDDGSDEEPDIHGLDDGEDDEFNITERPAETPALKVHVLPLYSQLPTKAQMRVFESPPDGSRLIVLSTNVAETSLTIPGIRYVFDCGRSKERKYDERTGIQSFEVGWISKASAEQRAGRAGRTGPGHCYRLYSSAVYERDFERYAEPEILRVPIEGLVLQLKSMGIHKVVNYPFPTSPDREQLAKAERLLQYLGAIDDDGKVTAQGRPLSNYPLSPRFSRMLVIGQNHGLIVYIIALVSALAVPDLIIPEHMINLVPREGDKDVVGAHSDDEAADGRDRRRRAYNTTHASLAQFDRTSDAVKLLAALCAFGAERKRSAEDFAEDMFLHLKALQEASQLRQQLTGIVRKENPRCGITGYEAALPPPSGDQVAKLNHIVAAGFVDQVAQRADLCPNASELPARRAKRAVDVPYVTLFPSHERCSGDGGDNDPFVYLHASSVLAHRSVKSLPRFVVYSRLQRAAPSASGAANIATPRVRMHPLCAITGTQLTALAKGTPLLRWGKPIGKIVDKGHDNDGKEQRECYVVPALVGEKGGLGWPLPAKRVLQTKEGGGKGWVIRDVS